MGVPKNVTWLDKWWKGEKVRHFDDSRKEVSFHLQLAGLQQLLGKSKLWGH